jgi:hypothetical protein
MGSVTNQIIAGLVARLSFERLAALPWLRW